MKSVLSRPVEIKVVNILKRFIKESQSQIKVECIKDNYLTSGGFNIYLVQGENKIWVDSFKNKSLAEKKAHYISSLSNQMLSS